MLVQVSLRIDGEIYRRVAALVARANSKPLSMGASVSSFIRAAITAALLEVEGREAWVNGVADDSFTPSATATDCAGGGTE